MIPASQAVRRKTQLVRPSFRVKQDGTSTTATSTTATIPATAQVGDYAILALDAVGTDATPASPSGWTLLGEVSGGSGPPDLWVWGKFLVGGEPGSNVVFTGLTGEARQWVIAAYQNVGGIDCVAAPYKSSVNEPANNLTGRLDGNYAGEMSLRLGIVSLYSYAALGNTALTVTTIPSGCTLRSAVASANNALVFARGLALWDGPNVFPQYETPIATDGSATHKSGMTLALRPVSSGWADYQYVPASLQGQPCLQYGHSLLNLVEPPASDGSAVYPYNTQNPYNERIAKAMGDHAGSKNLSMGGACAEDICSFAFGTHANPTRTRSAAAITRVGTFTAQTAPKLILCDLYGNNMISELSPASQVRDGCKLAMEAVIRLWRSALRKNHNDASITYTGTWTAPTSDGYMGGAVHQTTVSGSKASFTTTESAIDLLLIAQDNTKLGTTGSTFTVKVNGVTVVANTVSNRMKATGGGGGLFSPVFPDYGFVQYPIALEGLSGTSTIEIEHTGSSGHVLQVQGYLTRSADPPWIVMNVLPPFNPSDVSSYFSPTQEADYKALALAVAALFDYRVIVYDPGASGRIPTPPGAGWYMNDFVHIKDKMHSIYTQEILRTLSERVA